MLRLDGAGFSPCGSVDSLRPCRPAAPAPSPPVRSPPGRPTATPAIERFTIATTPPDTLLTGGPNGSIPTQEALWELSSSLRTNEDEPLPLRFLDDEPDESCEREAEATEMCAGQHVFHAATFRQVVSGRPLAGNRCRHPDNGPGLPKAPTIDPPTVTTLGATRAAVEVQLDAGGFSAARSTSTTARRPPDAMALPDGAAYPNEASESYDFGTPVPRTGDHLSLQGHPDHAARSRLDPGRDRDHESGARQLPSSRRSRTANRPWPKPTPASLPFTIDPRGEDVRYRLYIEANAPATPASPELASCSKTRSPLGSPRRSRGRSRSPISTRARPTTTDSPRPRPAQNMARFSGPKAPSPPARRSKPSSSGTPAAA